MINDDINMITWVGQDYPLPTQQELNNAIKAVEDKEAQDIQDKEDLRNSALAKLQALGLTAEEAKAVAGL
jgi:hypothetical protein